MALRAARPCRPEPFHEGLRSGCPSLAPNTVQTTYMVIPLAGRVTEVAPADVRVDRAGDCAILLERLGTRRKTRRVYPHDSPRWRISRCSMAVAGRSDSLAGRSASDVPAAR